MDKHIMDATEVYLGLLLEAGCKPLFSTSIAGKPYVWLKSNTGSIFLERLPDDATE